MKSTLNRSSVSINRGDHLDNRYPLAEFTESLFLDARAVVAEWQLPSPDDLAVTTSVIQRVHKIAAAEAPSSAPKLDTAAALWGVTTMYWCSSVFVDRASIETQLPASLADDEPQGTTPRQHWSTDLGLRFLPSLIQRSERIAKDDPLGITLLGIASRWPLSAIGTAAEIDECRLNLIASDDCLRGIMVDRILLCRESQSTTVKSQAGRWLELSQFQVFIQQAIGGYPELN